MSETEAALWSPPTLQKDRRPDALGALKAVPLFTHLTDGELARILRIMHERSYQAGEVVFREGQAGAGMYIIKRGAVSISIRLADGSDKVVAALGDQQFFGEMALLDDAPRSATCVATQRTELLGFFQPDMESLRERDAKLGSKVLWNLARLMAERVRGMNETLKSQRGEKQNGAAA